MPPNLRDKEEHNVMAQKESYFLYHYKPSTVLMAGEIVTRMLYAKKMS